MFVVCLFVVVVGVFLGWGVLGCFFVVFFLGGLCCFFTVKDKLVANVLYYPNFILFYIVSNNYNCLHQIIQILNLIFITTTKTTIMI